MAHTLTNTSVQTGIFSRLSSLFEEAKAARARRRDYARTVTELQRLTDRELADLGLGRSDIVETVRRHVYGD